MKKLILVVLIILISAFNVFSQSIVVFEHSNNLNIIYENFKEKVQNFSLNYNYFDSGIEMDYLPLLNDNDKNVIGNDNYYIIFLHGSGIVDLDILFLCNNKAKESVVFIFQKEPRDVFIPCSIDIINEWLLYQYIESLFIMKGSAMVTGTILV